MQSLRHEEHVITNFANEGVGFNCLLGSERVLRKISSLLCTICSRKYCPKQPKARDLSLDVDPLKLPGFGFKNRITDGHNLDTCKAVHFSAQNYLGTIVQWLCDEHVGPGVIFYTMIPFFCEKIKTSKSCNECLVAYVTFLSSWPEVWGPKRNYLPSNTMSKTP